MKIETQPKIEKVPDLADLEFEIPRFVTIKDKSLIENRNFNIKFNGNILKLNIHNQSCSKTNEKKYIESVMSISKNKKEFACIILNIGNYLTDYYKATTEVKNSNRGVEGIGRALWETALGLIKKTATQNNIPIIHVVSKEPSEGLTNEKWDELFLPLLEKYGYIKTRENFWEKTYLPQKGKEAI